RPTSPLFPYTTLFRSRVEAVVDQPFGDIVHGDVARFPERTEVENALVGDEPVGARIQDRIVRGQPFGDVIGCENCGFGRGLQTRSEEHTSELQSPYDL